MISLIIVLFMITFFVLLHDLFGFMMFQAVISSTILNIYESGSKSNKYRPNNNAVNKILITEMQIFQSQQPHP